MSKYFKSFNFNPWKKHINDCAIRSVSAGIGMSYKDVCKQLGFACKNGHGLVRDTGTDLDDLKIAFNDYFGNVTDFTEGVPDDLRDMDAELMKFDIANGIDSTSSGLTVEDFIDMFRDDGRFLVGCVSPEGDGHITFVNCSRGMNFFIDTFDCSEFTVDSWMQIKKVLPMDDPRRYRYDKENHKFIV